MHVATTMVCLLWDTFLEAFNFVQHYSSYEVLIVLYIHSYVYIYIHTYICVCVCAWFAFCCGLLWIGAGPYPSWLLHRHWSNPTVILVPENQPWRTSVNKSHESTKIHCKVQHVHISWDIPILHNITLIARFMGPTWGLQDPGGPQVGPMNLAIRVISLVQNQIW